MDAATGGCQCGAVRFRVEGALREPSICHCRMCQKAFGAFYAPLVGVRREELVWTKREPKRFRSSNHVRRGFCDECGTPLTYEAPDGMALAVGAFDDPSGLAPVVQYGTEEKLSFADAIPSLPERATGADAPEPGYLADIVSYQHPDRPGPDER